MQQNAYPSAELQPWTDAVIPRASLFSSTMFPGWNDSQDRNVEMTVLSKFKII